MPFRNTPVPPDGRHPDPTPPGATPWRRSPNADPAPPGPRPVPGQRPDPVPGAGVHPLVPGPRPVPDVLHQHGAARLLRRHVGRLPDRPVAPPTPAADPAAVGVRPRGGGAAQPA